LRRKKQTDMAYESKREKDEMCPLLKSRDDDGGLIAGIVMVGGTVCAVTGYDSGENTGIQYDENGIENQKRQSVQTQ
jgi:hypothetical protein